YGERERPFTAAPKPAAVTAADVPAPNDPMAALEKLLACPDLSSKRWIWEQYDHMVMADTLGDGRPGGGAAVVRVHGTKKALAITTDCTPRYCKADPVEGGRQAVAEAWRNLTAVGARPLAITDCLNFGNPEKPDIMGQFVGCIEGMREACEALDFPVVSGNVSFYNETGGNAVLPTPAIGGVGLLEDYDLAAGLAFEAEGETLVLIGETRGHLGQSLYLREVEGREDGSPPPVDLAAEKRNGDFVRELIASAKVTACNDVADGGILVAVAAMALASTIGATIRVPEDGGDGVPAHAWLFGEDQGRYMVTTDDPDGLLAAAQKAGVPALPIGITGGEGLSLLGGEAETTLDALRKINESWLPDYMGGA
ncbi:MAG: phosphoribosylformylglycinamidine synthase II, partial [Nitrospinae bacterium]|nr:phosphoribosylformylglycinamidine synthase II [Nitrospinota bacterium]